MNGGATMKATMAIIATAVGAMLFLTLLVEGVDAQGRGGRGKGQGLRLRDGSCITGTTTPQNNSGQRSGRTGGYGNGSGISPQDGTGLGPGDGTRPRTLDGTGFGQGAQQK
jgi:hypothetical protein